MITYTSNSTATDLSKKINSDPKYNIGFLISLYIHLALHQSFSQDTVRKMISKNNLIMSFLSLKSLKFLCWPLDIKVPNPKHNLDFQYGTVFQDTNWIQNAQAQIPGSGRLILGKALHALLSHLWKVSGFNELVHKKYLQKYFTHTHTQCLLFCYYYLPLPNSSHIISHSSVSRAGANKTPQKQEYMYNTETVLSVLRTFQFPKCLRHPPSRRTHSSLCLELFSIPF